MLSLTPIEVPALFHRPQNQSMISHYLCNKIARHMNNLIFHLLDIMKFHATNHIALFLPTPCKYLLRMRSTEILNAHILQSYQLSRLGFSIISGVSLCVHVHAMVHHWTCSGRCNCDSSWIRDRICVLVFGLADIVMYVLQCVLSLV